MLVLKKIQGGFMIDYGSMKWKKKRLKILKRDGYRDKVAEMYGQILEGNMVHHIYPASQYPQWAYEDWNLITINKEKTHNKLENRKTGELTELGRQLQNFVEPFFDWRKKLMELLQQQEEMIEGLNQLKNFLITTNLETDFINLINDCIEYISMPIPIASLTQEDFQPINSKPSVHMEFHNPNIILSVENISDFIEHIPPLFSVKLKNFLMGGYRYFQVS